MPVADLLPILSVAVPAIGSMLGGFWWYRLRKQRLDLYKHVLDTRGPKAGVEVIKALKTEFPDPWRHRRDEKPDAVDARGEPPALEPGVDLPASISDARGSGASSATSGRRTRPESPEAAAS